MKSKPPRICPMAQCDASLNFQPTTPWPSALPAVAVNGLVLAGFSQELVFDHELGDSEKISGLFRSLYFELSFAEAVRLIACARAHPWFPLNDVISEFGWQPNEHFFKVADFFQKTPAEFQKWAGDKKLHPQDLSPLLAGTGLNLEALFNDIVSLRLSKSLGTQALELGIELLLMGLGNSEIAKTGDAETWIEQLRRLRYPLTYEKDLSCREKMTSLPWPGTSQARWTRQGDKAGIELKLFVSQPSDLKKYLQSLVKVQDLLEKDPTGVEH